MTKEQIICFKCKKEIVTKPLNVGIDRINVVGKDEKVNVWHWDCYEIEYERQREEDAMRPQHSDDCAMGLGSSCDCGAMEE